MLPEKCQLVFGNFLLLSMRLSPGSQRGLDSLSDETESCLNPRGQRVRCSLHGKTNRKREFLQNPGDIFQQRESVRTPVSLSRGEYSILEEGADQDGHQSAPLLCAARGNSKGRSYLEQLCVQCPSVCSLVPLESNPFAIRHWSHVLPEVY